MPNGFQVESGLLRTTAASVEGCCRQIESGRKAGAAEGVSTGMAGFAVAGACESASEASGVAFSGVARSWRAWSSAAADGATEYDQIDASSETAIRRAGSDVVV
ncbi:MAG: hypothetical protein WBA97_39155 [Actinophytocola sp.]|uniref:hypothetical protein n=1 Tax=Actinophytocola sp. TaxID=1872138 RepID=UPI003C7677EC